jgi:hypothetical protein
VVAELPPQAPSPPATTAPLKSKIVEVRIVISSRAARAS